MTIKVLFTAENYCIVSLHSLDFLALCFQELIVALFNYSLT